MYRSALRAHPWTTSAGYVCHSCRHRLAQTQTRHASSQPQTGSDAGGGGGGDEFLDFFNNLGEGVPRQEKPAPPRREAKQEKNTKIAAPERERRLGRVAVKRSNVAEHETTRREDDAKHEATADILKMPEGMAVLKASLAARVEGKVVDGKKPGTAFRRQESLGAPTSARSDRSLSRRQRRAMRALEKAVGVASEDAPQHKSVVRLLSVADHTSSQDTEQPSAHVAAEEGSVVEVGKKERSDFEALMAGLVKQTTATPPPSEKVGVDRLLAQLEAKKTALSAPVDEVQVPAGITNTQEDGDGTVHSQPRPRIEKPDFPFPTKAAATTATPLSRRQRIASSDSPGLWTSKRITAKEDGEVDVADAPTHRTFSFARKPASLAAKIREASTRPSWGGFSSAVMPANLSKSKLSFDSLREADKVSAKPLVRTAGERTAWGGEVVQRAVSEAAGDAEAGFAASPGELAENPEAAGVEDAWVKAVTKNRDRDTSARDHQASVADDQDKPANTQTDVLEDTIPGKSDTASASKTTAAPPRGLRISYGKPGATIKPMSAEEESMELWTRDIQQQNQENLAAEKRATRLSPKRRKRAASRAAKAQTKEPPEPELKGVAANDATERLAKLHERNEVQCAAEVEHMSIAEAMAGSTPDDAENREDITASAPEPYETPVESSDIRTLSAGALEVTALNIQDQPAVPPLQYGLDRVLFNPGVYQMQDPLSRTYNFDPYLQNIMPIAEFDFNALKEYKTSSADGFLGQLANEHGKKYVGSTSSMTGTLGHFHYLLSNWRDLNLNMLSKGFSEQLGSFTQINRAPNAIFLRYKKASGTYAIDADKEFDTPNVLMMLGKSMEKLLTMPKEQYERYRRDNTTDPITDAEKHEPEAFEYTTMGDFLMRSQLDAYDPRLPGTGMFDLKTRAVLPIRMDTEGYEAMLGYEIFTLQGKWESYEREYYDMMRSTMLKYMLQARMGRMDGIFLAYHNIQRIFGFQYLPMMDIDRAIHGQVDPCLGDQEFRISLRLLNEALEMATKKFPERSLRLHFEAAPSPENMMWIFAEPMEESEIEGIQRGSKESVAEFEAKVMGIERKPVVEERKGADDRSISSSAASTASGDGSSSNASSTYASTTSSADSSFINTLDHLAPGDENLKPLFAATLLLQNFVNGVPCTNNRPASLARKDDWEVQYILKEAPISLAGKWARYDSMKARRKGVLAKAEAEESVDEVVQGRTKDSSYIGMLKGMVERGRNFRKAVDKVEVGEKKFVGDAGGVRQLAVTDVPAEAEKVDSVDGYMQWLYGKGK